MGYNYRDAEISHNSFQYRNIRSLPVYRRSKAFDNNDVADLDKSPFIHAVMQNIIVDFVSIQAVAVSMLYSALSIFCK